jgi:ribonuclease P protein component
MVPAGSQKLHPAERLKRPADFQRVYNRRRSVSNEWIVIYGCNNGLTHCRLGLSVSRKTGGAVRRNRLRRLYREAFRLSKHAMPVGFDLVVIPRTADDPTLDQLVKALPRLVLQLADKLQKEQKVP